MLKTKTQATTLGLIAVVLWGAIVGSIKTMAETFGPSGGPALLYSCATLILAAWLGLRPIGAMPKRYLIWGGSLFVLYELCFALSIAYSTSARQALEVGMVNYLWPSFALLGTILARRERINAWLLLGLIMAFLGVARVLGGEQGFSLSELLASIASNPLSFSLAFLGALIWAAYCVVTPRLAGGQNGIVAFFAATALMFWVKTAFSQDIHFPFGLWPIASLLLASAAMGASYAAWNVAISHGNAKLLACASYFTPVLSVGLTALILQAALSGAFWQGASLVCIGSLISWLASRKA